LTEQEIVEGALNWDNFYKANESMIPYTNLCVFAFKAIKNCEVDRPVIFEFGCGSGNNLYALHDIFKDSVSIFGCDVSVNAIQQCSRKMPQAKFWVNDADLYLSKDSIDLFIERGSLHCVTKKIAADYMKQLYIAMKPGSNGFIEMPSVFHGLSTKGKDPNLGHREFYTLDELGWLLRDFEIQKTYLVERKTVCDIGATASTFSSYNESSYQVEFKKSS
jgi:SAM-dependent methyltransferase